MDIVSALLVGANQGQNVHLSDLVSDILEPLATIMESLDTISTEDWLANIDEHNTKIETKKTSGREDHIEWAIQKEEKTKNSGPVTKESMESEGLVHNKKCQLSGKIVAVGADAKGLYPSLESLASGRAVYRAVVASDLEFEGIDYKDTLH